jgi:hypothetical protein
LPKNGKKCYDLCQQVGRFVKKGRPVEGKKRVGHPPDNIGENGCASNHCSFVSA